MERVVSIPNLQAALKRVETNRGSPGIDGMTWDELRPWLRVHWKELCEQLLGDRYRPTAVKRVDIEKRGGGLRTLGIPSVLDRFIQQACLQVLQPIFDPTFSKHSHGFRPGRRAQDAIREAQGYVQEGRHWVVDVDLEKFFDRVNHDVLMGRLAKRIDDKRMLRLIRRYLEAGMMADGVVIERHEGTPQGGPLSPLLANVLLDEVDRELERTGHAFVRYADDCNVYVRSRKAGERVMARLSKLYGKLRLKINAEKSAVAPVFERQFLGLAFWVGPGGKVKRRVAKKALQAMKSKVREITDRNGGRSLLQVVEALRRFLLGWRAYFRQADTPGIFRDLDGWIRRRLRMLQLKQWKRGPTAFRELRARGVSRDTAAIIAADLRRWWHNARQLSHVAFPNRYYNELGLPRLAP
ncbi:MAG TPA: group II intron reverse transcriptase/maturase [Polyangia bacterium]|nr:group II intron reverse transcriptase/maturase [Polyangia bacterium]